MYPASQQLITAQEALDLDAFALSKGVELNTLMENAGNAVYQEILQNYPLKKNILILCGPGNNGGDGFVAARLLKKSEFNVKVASLFPFQNLTGLPKMHADKWQKQSSETIHSFEDVKNLLHQHQFDIIIDSIFGVGLSRPLEGITQQIIDIVNRYNAIKIAIDIASGINSDSGNIVGSEKEGNAFKAHLTITFHRKKRGHIIHPGENYCGKVIVKDIGIPNTVEVNNMVYENSPEIWQTQFPWPTSETHKYSRGLCHIYGSETMMGATKLAALSALRVGAGYVTILCSERTKTLYNLSSPSLVVKSIKDTLQFKENIQDKYCQSILIGPGNEVNTSTREKVLASLYAEKKTILDGGALSVFENNVDLLKETIKSDCILTPHEGEFVRLFPEIQGSVIERAQQAAKQLGAIIVLKGAQTCIADPNGKTILNNNASPFLATAGTGDVLAGMITGIIAQGMDSFEACGAAVWLHGEASRMIGEGLISEDLPQMIPQVLKKIKKIDKKD